jgi:hypothetical protein
LNWIAVGRRTNYMYIMKTKFVLVDFLNYKDYIHLFA